MIYLESKFDGDIGTLGRKHVLADFIVYIGKEANNIDDQALDVKSVQEFSTSKKLWVRFFAYHKSRLKHWGFLGVLFKELRRG